jgi:hypothetical protein
MENQDREIAEEVKTEDFSFKKHALKAILGSLYYIFIYIPFILPIKIWGKASARISLVWDSKSISYNENNSKYPIYLFYFNYLINFVFDAFSVLIWPIGFIYCVYSYIDNIKYADFVQDFIMVLVPIYLSVIVIRFAKETLFFMINNLVSWVLEVISNIGKLIKNLWLLNIVVKRKEDSKKPMQKINTSEL